MKLKSSYFTSLTNNTALKDEEEFEAKTGDDRSADRHHQHRHTHHWGPQLSG